MEMSALARKTFREVRFRVERSFTVICVDPFSKRKRDGVRGKPAQMDERSRYTGFRAPNVAEPGQYAYATIVLDQQERGQNMRSLTN
jgi:hypothetical protein